jgi:elongation factor Tu-like protein
MRTLNFGVLARVDAGKTSLTERLLYAAGVIDEIGNDSSTQTDTLALEQERGITIKSDDVAINLIDTPGHPDFIAEVERALPSTSRSKVSPLPGRGLTTTRSTSRGTCCASRGGSSQGEIFIHGRQQHSFR